MYSLIVNGQYVSFCRYQIAPRLDESSDEDDDDEGEDKSKEAPQSSTVTEIRKDDYANDDDDYIL